MQISSLRMLRHFIAAAQTGNFHRAAENIHLSQSAITKSIQSLEQTLGVALFERGPRGVTLTRSGDALYARALRVENECQNIDREFAEIVSGKGGFLTIGAGAVWSTTLLPPVLNRLYQRSASARFTVLRSAGPLFLEQFESGQIDVGLGSLDSFADLDGRQSENFIQQKLSSVTTAFFARSDHPLHAAGEVTLEALCQYGWASFRSDQLLQTRVRAFFSRHGLNQPQPSLVCDSISMLMQTLKLSPMIACLPKPLGRIATYFDVSPLPFPDSPWSFDSGVVYRRADRGYPLLDLLLAELAGIMK